MLLLLLESTSERKRGEGAVIEIFLLEGEWGVRIMLLTNESGAVEVSAVEEEEDATRGEKGKWDGCCRCGIFFLR